MILVMMSSPSAVAGRFWFAAPVSSPHFVLVVLLLLEQMMQTCRDSVEISDSTIPGAGRGLFASRDIAKGTIIALYPIHSLGCQF